MKINFTIALALIFAGVVQAQEPAGKWYKTNLKGCKVYLVESWDFHALVWNGDCKDGLLEGSGELRANSKGGYLIYKYTGSISAGKFNGQGELFCNSSNYYKGFFVDGLLNGKGEANDLDDIYVGDFVNGKYDGLGVLTEKEGNKYEGEFKKGYFEGKGKLQTSKGESYVGGFERGEYSGYGEKKEKNGQISVGHFKLGSLYGKGFVVLPSGDSIVGEFSAGYPEPEAYYIWKNGTKFQGTYIDRYTPATGKLYEKGIHVADLLDGKRVAKQRTIPSNGFMVGEDLYIGDRNIYGLNGTGKICFANGDTLSARFSNGKVLGEGLYIYANGMRFLGTIRDNKPYDGKVYQNQVFQYEMLYGEQKGDANATTTSYPEGQYNPWNKYTKEKATTTVNDQNNNQTETKTNYNKGVATYKGVSDYDLVVEIQANVLYKAKKDPGMLGLTYYDVAEAEGIRFRYPGTSNTWYNFKSGDYIYTCIMDKVEYTCASIGGMVFKLSLPDIN